jgi:cyclopropane fatty-acyl-phospholipid synthase-like methyltransferase
MIYDRLYLRRRRDAGWLPSFKTGRITQEEARATGYTQLAKLADMIEARTGASLESRTALDFGCGWGRLALPLAERCEHVFGVEVSQLVLNEAERIATEASVTNVEWLQVDRLEELRGRYDLVISVLVFQHIPVAEGERLFTTLVRGLRPDGVGAIELVLRPAKPVARLLAAPKRLRGQLHMLRGSYSLNRIGRLLAAEGVSDWHVDYTRAPTADACDTVRVTFTKR